MYPTLPTPTPSPRAESHKTESSPNAHKQSKLVRAVYSKHPHRSEVQLISPDHSETGSEIAPCAVATPCDRLRCRSAHHTSKYSKFELGWHCELDNVQTGVSM